MWRRRPRRAGVATGMLMAGFALAWAAGACGRSNDSSGHNTFDSQPSGVDPDSVARARGQQPQ
jgi:hypothetical protein